MALGGPSSGHMSENFENKRHLASLESLSNLIYTSILSFDHLGRVYYVSKSYK